MERPDARHLSIETQEYLRQQAIRLRQAGKRIKDISEFLGVHRNTVSWWCWEYQLNPETGAYQQTRGRQLGDGRILTPEEEDEVQAAMQGHSPEDYGIDSAVWTGKAVQSLIEQCCGEKMAIRTVREYLKRWDYTLKQAQGRAYEQDPKAVEEWVKHTYPAIAERARQEGATIEWGDEAGLSCHESSGRGYSPRGHVAESRPSQGPRGRVNYIASFGQSGSVRFMLYLCKFTAQVFITYLKRLIKGRTHKLFLLVDQDSAHKKAEVKQWLQEHSQQIEVFELPTYSPALNAVEYLNSSVKQGVHDKAPTRNLGQLEQRVRSRLHQLQKLPDLIRNYFRHPSLAYVTAL